MADGRITPIRSKAKPRRFSTYDLEWVPGSLDLRMVGVYDPRDGFRAYYNKKLARGPTTMQGAHPCPRDCEHCEALREYARTHDPDREGTRQCIRDFLNGEMTEHNRGRWFYAHAGGLADFQFILEFIADEIERLPHISIDGAFSGSSCILATIKWRTGRIIKRRRLTKKGDIVEDQKAEVYQWHLIDSLWLIRQPLAAIGKWLGYPKGDVPFHAPLRDLRDYNRDDCRILWQAIDKFEDALLGLGGQLEKTVASSAMGLFRRRFLNEEIPTWDEVNTEARSSYIASRVEVLQKSCGEADYYDINSSFPNAMMSDAPGKLLRSQKRKPDSGIYMALATVKVPEMWLPPLGYRTDEGRLFFPTGQWRAWFMNTDLDLLEETGGSIDRIERVKVFAPFNALRDYAQTVYALRNESDDDAHRQAYKILLNSLYGKFAERGARRSLRINPTSTECPHKHPTRSGEALHPSHGEPGSCFEYLSAGLWYFDEEKRVPHAHVPIASHITAVARKELYTHLDTCAPDVYYCDTDGFATGRKMPTGRGLGELKHEHSIRQGVFAAPKLVAYDSTDAGWIVKAKGFRKLDYPAFCELLEGGEVEREHMVRIRELLNRGETVPAEEIRRKAYRARVQPKRCYHEDGTSRPWAVGEIE